MIHEDVEEMEDVEDVVVEEILVEEDDDIIITPHQLKLRKWNKSK
jgi:hypothetical protein